MVDPAPKAGYINLKSNERLSMTRSAAYKLQIIADRRAAAAERRAEIQATGRNEITERRKLYNLV